MKKLIPNDAPGLLPGQFRAARRMLRTGAPADLVGQIIGRWLPVVLACQTLRVNPLRNPDLPVGPWPLKARLASRRMHGMHPGLWSLP